MIWRAITVPDAPAWSALIDAVSAADGSDEHYDAADLVEDLEVGESVGVFDGAHLVAYGQAEPAVRRFDGTVRATFTGAVHPEWRGRGIGTELLHRLETQVVAQARAAFPGADPLPATHAMATATSARELLEANSYAVLRWFHVMGISPSVGLADDRVQPYDSAIDDLVRLAHVDAFSGHWGSAPPTDDVWRLHATGARSFRPALSFLAAVDGEVAAYSLAYQFQADELWVGQLGVRAAHRGGGLGRSVLLATLSAAAAAGIPRVKLAVDSENPTQAGRLYASVGFSVERQYATYEKRV